MTSMTRTNSSMRTILLVGRGVMIETLRRKDLAVLMMLAGIYVLGIVVAFLVGIENAATVAFLLNLGISFAWFAAHLLALLSAARQVPDEMENRTLHPLLAKPVHRVEYLLGKWGASALCGLLTFWLLLICAMFPWLFSSVRPELDMVLFLQAAVVTSISVPLVAALALLFSLLMPKPVTITLLAIMILFAHKAAQFLRARYDEAAAGDVITWVLGYVPNFAKLNLFDRYTDGMDALGMGTFLGLCLYAVLYTAAALAVADRLFARQPL